MAEIDPLVAEILLKGDDEFLGSLKKVGEEGAENIEKLNKAFESGASSFKLAEIGLLAVETAIAAVTAATILFVEQQTELSQATELLANSFGATGEQLQHIEEIFASAGVKVEQFERLAVRVTTSIAREWPQVAESVRNYANDQDAATLRVQNAILRVQDAQNRLADNSAERASQMSKDNDAVEAAYIKLEFAAQHAASEQLAALQTVRGAQLSVTAAEQHLAELEGRPPSAAEKENLALAQAQQAVDTARRAAADALIAQQEKAAQAALTRRQQEAAYDDLSRKAAKDARDDAEQRQKDENAVRDAIVARGEAEERATKFALTNVGSIAAALDGIATGNKNAASAIDLTQVSVENLEKSVFALASQLHGGIQPSGFEALRTVSNLLTNDTGHLISEQQRLALVTKLAGTSMQALGVSAAEILNVLEHDSAAFETLANAARSAAPTIDSDKDKIEAFRGALARFNLTVSQLSQAFAAAISPALTSFLNTLNDSLTKSDGFLHEVIDGFKAFGDLLSYVGGKAAELSDWISNLVRSLTGLDISRWDILRATLIGIGVAVTAALGPIAAIGAAIVLAVAAAGALYANWDKIAAAAKSAWEAVKDNSVIRFFERMLDLVTRIGRALGLISPGAVAAAAPHGQSDNSSGQDDPQGVATVGRAQGGPIDGPGTTTSDSILARLSRGEYVIKAAAVQQYGSGLFHALNNMLLPGFASGGLVPSPVRMAGASASAGSSTLNLSIDGRSFNGLRGPKNVIDDLTSFAIGRQTASAGNQPSWVK